MSNYYYGGKKKKENPQASIEKKTGHGWHSQPYHRYFEDYVEYETTDENGKVKIIRSYQGEWYLARTDNKSLLFKKLLITAAWIITTMAFAVAATRNTTANGLWFVAIPVFAAVVSMVWNLISIVEYYTAQGAMTISKYKRSVLGFRRSSQIAFIAFATCLVMTVAAILIFGGAGVQPWISVGLFAASAGMMLISNCIERKITYERNQAGDIAVDDVSYIE